MKFQVATTLTTFLLAGSGAGFPTIPRVFQPLRARNDTEAAQRELAEKVLIAAPNTATCAANLPECRTASQLSKSLLASLQRYQVTSPGAVAAVVALTAFESLDYKYKVNLNPQNHGQGTSNMQMFAFNYKYALSIPELSPKVAEIGIVDPATATDEQKDQILQLVIDDEYNFGSGPWFLTTQCPINVLVSLADGSDAAFSTYMTDCVGTTMTADRTKYWEDAKKAWGLA